MGVLNISGKYISVLLKWKGQEDLLITACNVLLCIGAAFGAWISEKLSNFFGRRHSIIRTNFVLVVTIGVNLVPTTITFLIGRLLTGICVGIFSVIPPIFISEISPDKIKVLLGSFIQLNISFGIFCSLILSDYSRFISSHLYRLLLLYGFPLLVAALQTFLLIKVYKVDSPSWLYSNGRIRDTETVLKSIYHSYAWQLKMNSFDQKSKIPSLTQSQPSAILLRNPKTLAYILCFVQQLSGINVITFYSKDIFAKTDSIKQRADDFTVFIGLCNFLVIFPIIWVIQKLTRKTVMEIGLMGMFLSYVGYILIEVFLDGLYKAYISFMGLLSATLCFQLALGTALWIYLTEILAICWVGTGISVQWIGAAGVGGIYPLLLIRGLKSDLEILFAICSTACLFGFLVVFKLASEIKDLEHFRSLNETVFVEK